MRPAAGAVRPDALHPGAHVTSSPAATLAGIAGRGYAVIESLPALGKGRACAGVFTTGAEHRSRLEALAGSGEPVVWAGVVHARHRSGEASLPVVVDRVGDEGDGLLVEFSAAGVSYDLVE